MKKLINTIAFVAFITSSVAQIAPQHSLGSNSGAQFYPRGFLTTLAGPPAGVTGSSYIYDSWIPADIQLKDEKIIQDISVKMDVKNNYVEIDYNGQVKILPFDKIKLLDLKHLQGKVDHFLYEQVFVNDTPIRHLFQIVVGGEYNLLLRTKATEVAPNYNAALDIGNKDAQLVLEETYFIVKNRLGVEVTNSKKKVASQLNTLFKRNFDDQLDGIKLSKEADLIELVKSMNTAVSKENP